MRYILMALGLIAFQAFHSLTFPTALLERKESPEVAFLRGKINGRISANMDIMQHQLESYTKAIATDQALQEMEDELTPTYFPECMKKNKKLNDERIKLDLRIFSCMIWQKLSKRILFYQGYRSRAEQKEMFDRKVSKLDGSPGRESEHQRGRATDYVLLDKEGNLRWGKTAEDRRDYGYYGGYITGYFEFFRFVYSGTMSVDESTIRLGITGWRCGHSTKNSWDFGHLEYRRVGSVQSECSQHFLENEYL